jgi:hypothetical protein
MLICNLEYLKTDASIGSIEGGKASKAAKAPASISFADAAAAANATGRNTFAQVFTDTLTTPSSATAISRSTSASSNKPIVLATVLP